MGVWKKQSEKIDEMKSLALDLEEKANSDTIEGYTKTWEDIYYLAKDNLKTLGVKL